ncbi:MAG: ATP phosphoribosyltransferase [Planctomycetota bacterium]|nr:ATP phosphoribosyltransferase [Planctomycetota bacterium]
MEQTMPPNTTEGPGTPALLRMALPKGRMQPGVFALLADAGIDVRVGARGYRPQVSLEGVDAKILKPQNVVEMLAAGSRDIGFAGADWVEELGADLVEVLDTGLDAVRMVAAAPAGALVGGRLARTPLVVASEYERLTRRWIESNGLEARFVLSYGATEVFPPEDADCIVDITATGETLRAQHLVVFDELMRSSTRVYASPRAMADPVRRGAVERLVMLLRSVLEARQRVMIEVNVSAEALGRVIEGLPCMREPTISPLHAQAGFAVKAAVPRNRLPALIPELKRRGGTDLVVSHLSQIVP